MSYVRTDRERDHLCFKNILGVNGQRSKGGAQERRARKEEISYYEGN